jgi:hypothetical protein
MPACAPAWLSEGCADRTSAWALTDSGMSGSFVCIAAHGSTPAGRRNARKILGLGGGSSTWSPCLNSRSWSHAQCSASGGSGGRLFTETFASTASRTLASRRGDQVSSRPLRRDRPCHQQLCATAKVEGRGVGELLAASVRRMAMSLRVRISRARSSACECGSRTALEHDNARRARPVLAGVCDRDEQNPLDPLVMAP